MCNSGHTVTATMINYHQPPCRMYVSICIYLYSIVQSDKKMLKSSNVKCLHVCLSIFNWASLHAGKFHENTFVLHKKYQQQKLCNFFTFNCVTKHFEIGAKWFDCTDKQWISHTLCRTQLALSQFKRKCCNLKNGICYHFKSNAMVNRDTWYGIEIFQ